MRGEKKKATVETITDRFGRPKFKSVVLPETWKVLRSVSV